MSEPIDFNRLKEYFDVDDIEWKPIALARSTGKGLAAAYVTNRAIMDRLDAVCGPANWKNKYKAGPDGGVICAISIRIGDEWVTKWDGAENTDIEPVKGGLSSAMRRAAVQWGIGRYLYNLPSQWVPVDEKGRFTQPPHMPAEFLPEGSKAQRTQAPPAPAQAPVPNQRATGAERPAQAAKNGTRRTSSGADEYFMPKRA